MVWIHGGGLRIGSGSRLEFDGKHFARNGVVLVTLNYRLGVFGFFAHPALTKEAAPGELLANYGLMDQIAALKWVQANIAAFGGDPGNVTIFGASAGGSSALVLMTTPSARGLFAKAIVESGSGWFGKLGIKAAEEDGIATASRAGLPGASASSGQLRALSPAALLKAAPSDVMASVDGRLITESVPQSFRDGHEAAVPLLIGSNSYEGSVMGSAMDPAVMLSYASPELRALYSGTDASVEAALFGDVVMGSAARWLARMHSARAPAFMYYFSYIGKFRRDGLPGAGHGDEVPYIFGNLTYVAWNSATEDDRMMQQAMHKCWMAFARDGKPIVPGSDWPAYTRVNDTLMNLGSKIEPATGFKKREYDVSEAIMLERALGSD